MKYLKENTKNPREKREIEVILAGTPNLGIQKETKAQSSAEVEDRGMASGQGEVLSMLVKR